MARRPQRRPDVLVRHVDDGIIALSPKSQQAHALEPLAARIFQACDGSLDVDALAERVAAPADQVTDILGSLAKAGMVEGLDHKMSRRTALAGGAGLGAGLVASIVLPTPAMASSEATSSAGQQLSGDEASSQENHANLPNLHPATGNQPLGSAGPGKLASADSSEPGFSSSKPHSGSGTGLAFTGMDVTETVAAAAGAIGTGAAIVAAAHRKTRE